MKTLLVIAAVAALAGCAEALIQQRYAQPNRSRSMARGVGHAGRAGHRARVAAASRDGTPVEYSSVPVSQVPIYTPPPVYALAPVYYPEPAYYWPPVSLSLGFVFGRHWGHGRGHYRGGGRRH
ncbi:hypothetical protein LP420_01230 [Massilia sp. B-10]|nr:hypothetical protein LP420_01230 [Massilia sp. B-10]